MTMSQFTGQHLMPFMARLVLGAAFFFAGWHLCFGTTEMTAAQEQAQTQTTATTDADKADASGEARTPAESQDESESMTAGQQPAALGLSQMLKDAGLGEWSTAAAWAAATISLLGGALLVVGLLTRLTSLILLVMVGVGFWASSIHAHGLFDMNPLDWAAHSMAFTEAFLLLASGVLLLGVLLVGPGVCALDHIVWPRHRRHPETGLAPLED